MTTANKLAEPKIRWFKTADQLGEVRLLPSDIESKVLISTKDKHPPNTNFYNYQPHPLFSVFCLIKPKIREIKSIISNKVIKDVKTPTVIFQYDFINLQLKARKNIGYLYQPPAKKCNTLSEMLKYVKGFHFPHIYENAYMCLSNRNHDSPRVLNNIFWDTSFNTYWQGNFDSKAGLHRYLERNNPERDKQHRGFLSAYKEFFEINKKPLAIFISDNERVLEKADNGFIKTRGGGKLVLGFAWYLRNRWFVYLKNNTFLRLTPEQVKAV